MAQSLISEQLEKRANGVQYGVEKESEIHTTYGACHMQHMSSSNSLPWPVLLVPWLPATFKTKKKRLFVGAFLMNDHGQG